MSDETAEIRIVAGVDGSECSIAALAFAVEEARMRGGFVQAIYAFVSPTLAGMTVPEDYFEDLERSAREDLEKAVARAVPSAENATSIVRTVVAGTPGEDLVRASAGATMLVVGSRGRGGFRELLLGSTSSQCVHHALCPVTVVR